MFSRYISLTTPGAMTRDEAGFVVRLKKIIEECWRTCDRHEGTIRLFQRKKKGKNKDNKH